MSNKPINPGADIDMNCGFVGVDSPCHEQILMEVIPLCVSKFREPIV
jgi:hypothetical protein